MTLTDVERQDARGSVFSRGSLYVCSYHLGRIGLAVACLTAVCEVLGSNCDVGSFVYRKTTVSLCTALGHGLCAPFLQC